MRGNREGMQFTLGLYSCRGKRADRSLGALTVVEQFSRTLVPLFSDFSTEGIFFLREARISGKVLRLMFAFIPPIFFPSIRISHPSIPPISLYTFIYPHHLHFISIYVFAYAALNPVYVGQVVGTVSRSAAQFVLSSIRNGNTEITHYVYV